MSTRNTFIPIRHFTGISLAAAVLMAAGCSSDSNSTDTTPVADNDTPVQAANIVYAFKETGGEEPEYLIAQSDLMNSSLSAQGAGYEQIGWNFYYPVDKTLFVTGYENFETQSYVLDENDDIQQLNSFVFENPLEVFGTADGMLLATDGPRDGSHSSLRLYLAEAATGQVVRQVSYSIDDVDTGIPGNGTVGWPTALIVRDDKLFVPFHKLDDAGTFRTPEVDTAYVAVFEWPLPDNATPEKIIADARTGHIGVNGMSSAMIRTEGGDIYGYSNGTVAAGFDPASTKPSGILKIASGETEFDEDYFFDVEAAGAGGTLFWFDYIGDNKALGRVITSDEGAYFYSGYSKDFFNEKLVLIDLEAQTVSDVQGVPLHQKRYTSPLAIIDGVVYLSIETADENAVYAYDIASGIATRGGAIEGKTVKGFYHLNGS